MADPRIPDGTSIDTAFSRTTHLAIGAHPDDLEVMAYHGVAECFESNDCWFGVVVVCDGAGSPQDGKTDGAEMIAARREEQNRAAELGRRRANATFSDSHAVDQVESLSYAVDLGPLVSDRAMGIASFVEERIARFQSDALESLSLWGNE